MKSQNKDKIIEVTLYSDRALVTRSFEGKVDVGSGKIVFSNLPLGIDKDALRVSGQGDASLKIESIDISDEYIAGYTDKQAEELYLKLEKLQDEMAILDAKIHLKNEEKALFVSELDISSAMYADEFYHKKALSEDINNHLKSFFCGYEAAITELDRFSEEKKALDLKIKRAKDEFDRIKSFPSKHVINCSVSYDVLKGGDFTFYLTYIVFNISWRPIYDIRLAKKEDKIDFFYYALVRQASGEKWEDVKMFISTSKPSVKASLPKLGPWFISAGGSLTADGFGMAISDYKPSEGGTEVSKSALNATFSLPKPVTLLSDDKEKKVFIMKAKLDANIEYRCYPKLYSAAYINAEIENTTPFPVLSGDVKVFHSSDYIGESKIDTLLIGEKAFVSLGVDNSIKVERKLLKTYLSQKGVIKDYSKKVYEYKIELANYKGRSVKIRVEEPIPVSMNKELKVKPEEVTDNVSPDAKGLLVWDVALENKAGKEIKFKYSIEKPSNRQLVGEPAE